jgi:hypothetical protein
MLKYVAASRNSSHTNSVPVLKRHDAALAQHNPRRCDIRTNSRHERRRKIEMRLSNQSFSDLANALPESMRECSGF